MIEISNTNLISFFVEELKRLQMEQEKQEQKEKQCKCEIQGFVSS